MTTDPIEIFLSRLQHPLLAGIDMSLDRMHRLLGMLGSPHKKMPPVIHVAGTNGKGSLLAYLHYIFEAAGYRVHRYTSPHLVQFRERILLQGKPVENAYLENIVKHLASVLATQPATFFEATTVLAFLAFAEKPADLLLLETGMGGRLDATNVIDKPLLTAITPVSFDHCEYLGNTLKNIAGEKAGIIKKAVPCVIGRQDNEALMVLEEKAQSLNAPLFRLGHEFHVERNGGTVMYRSIKRHIELRPSLAGGFQYDNAATAVACIDNISGFNVTDEHIIAGLAATQWPARLQKLEGHAYNTLLPADMPLYLDGGHNPQGGEMLAGWCAEQGAEVYLVCGMVKGKDASAYLKPLASHVKALYAVTIPGESMSRPVAELQAAAKGVGMEAEAAPSVEIALQTIARRAKTPAIVCICGSLYLAGKVLAVQEAA
jgi:dihydrofolate synthase/folylpolyglutamate synthase